MTTNKKGHELIPSARRLIKSLRDLGYDFEQAVADIIDNSIVAGALLIAVDVEFDGDDSWVRIADNGKGMSAEHLREAMRYGFERIYDEDDLGKFGLGLKTASMSQCQCLSVASRNNKSRANIAAYSWDLEHIEKTNRWEILPLERNGLRPTILNPLKDMVGTVVLWQRLDRILGYSHPYGEFSRKRLLNMCQNLEIHLAMVFGEFLSGKSRKKHFKILLNGNEIKPWDPFCRSEDKTKKLQPIRFNLEHEGTKGEVLIEPYIVPHQDDFSSTEAWRLAAGPDNWNQQQGFYIYRAERMIQSGGWCNLRAPDEHTKLARIKVSFSPTLDDAFKINVPKMRVQMPAQIREGVKEAITPVIKLAREIYDRRSVKRAAQQVTLPNKGASSKTEAGSRGSCLNNEVEKLTFDEWVRCILSVAKPNEKLVINNILSRLRKK